VIYSLIIHTLGYSIKKLYSCNHAQTEFDSLTLRTFWDYLRGKLGEILTQQERRH